MKNNDRYCAEKSVGRYRGGYSEPVQESLATYLRFMTSLLAIAALAITSSACSGGGGLGGFGTINIQPIQPGSNKAPELDPISNQTVGTGTETSFTVKANDAEGDNIRFSVSSVLGTPNLSGFVSIESTSRNTALLTIQPKSWHEGVFNIVVHATDDSEFFLNFDDERFTLTIRAAENQARSFYRLPVLVDGAAQAGTIGLGWSHSCLTAMGSESESLSETLCWGNNDSGQLGFESGPDTCGDENTACTGAPGPVDIPVSLVSVDGSTRHSCGLTEIGEAWCWGMGHGGPVPMPVQTNLRFVELKVAPGAALSCGLTEPGQLYCWEADIAAAPEPVADGFSFVTFDLGSDFACGRDSDFRTYCWGNNWYGQLGMGLGSVGQNGGPLSSDIPVEVFGNHKFSELSLGLSHACGLIGNGEVYCWGHIVSRTGLEELSGVPQGVEGEEGFRQIASGDLFTCGIPRGLNVPAVCWGNLDVGRVVGNSEFIFALRPVLLDPEVIPQSIAAGGAHACAISSDAVYCWGDNTRAQLGRLPGVSQ